MIRRCIFWNRNLLNYVLHQQPFKCCCYFHTKPEQIKHIDKVLIANRGEIACRVMRTAKRLGIRTVAVYSDADRDSLHVSMADEAFRLGEAPSRDSYLNQNKIIETALSAGVHAIHPGYGFLSENVEFAKLCQNSGLTFIGPSPNAIRDMGIKSTSKKIMSAADVPVVGGYNNDEDQSTERLKAEAVKIGFPVMIKAVRGGGGKGMRIAMTESVFVEQLESAKREAMKSFGDQIMLLEKFIINPRHIEVQVFGDYHGNYVHLFERDCSVQRRHQKIIEEAPAPGISRDVRLRLGEAAVRAARAVNYVGAGTVEFIMDENFDFFFMEMNTRLQVEHPITEMITGTDLVEWQFLTASGETLPLTQDEISLKGWAFEARIYAEDPSNEFMPGAGFLTHLCTPESSETTRIETGVRQGDEVSVHYDPMIAKLVVWASNRQKALAKLKQDLALYNIHGLSTNVNFLLDLASCPEFVAGNVDTEFIPRNKLNLFSQATRRAHTPLAACLALAALILNERSLRTTSLDPFDFGDHSRNHLVLYHEESKETISTKVLNVGDQTINVNVMMEDQSEPRQFFMHNASISSDRLWLTCLLKTDTSEEQYVKTRFFIDQDQGVCIFGPDGCQTFRQPKHKFVELIQQGTGESSTGSRGAVAPMPGVIEKIYVKEGDLVEVGEPLIVMIAMKMEYVIKAPHAGVVSLVQYSVGDFVKKKDTLIKFVEK